MFGDPKHPNMVSVWTDHSRNKIIHAMSRITTQMHEAVFSLISGDSVMILIHNDADLR